MQPSTFGFSYSLLFFSKKRLFAVELHFGIFLICCRLLLIENQKLLVKKDKRKLKTQWAESWFTDAIIIRTKLTWSTNCCLQCHKTMKVWFILKRKTCLTYCILRRKFPFAGPIKCLGHACSPCITPKAAMARGRETLFLCHGLYTWRLTVPLRTWTLQSSQQNCPIFCYDAYVSYSTSGYNLS
jgi:hypothetical protein